MVGSLRGLPKLNGLPAEEKATFITIRIITIIILFIHLIVHIRSMRVFRWEQSVSGGVLVTYLIAVIGLLFCIGTDRCRALQAYFLSTGAALMVANGAGLWRRWREANELTRAVAELLFVLGVPLKRQLMVKVWLSIVVAFLLLLDLSLIPMFSSS